MKAVNPLVSIIIPTFNRSDLLKETLDSLLLQSYGNWECILVDDGSDARQVAQIKTCASRDARISFFERKCYNPTKGANACRNIGIDRSKGDYLIFFDSDDLFLPMCLENRVKYCLENPEYDFVVFQVTTLSHQNMQTKGNLTKKKANYLHAYLSHSLPWTIMAPIIKAGVITSTNRFDENMPRLQDPDFYTGLLLTEGLNFKVLTDVKADCIYRLGINVPNLRNGLRGFYYYIKKYIKTDSNLIAPNILIECLSECYFQSYHYFNNFYTDKAYRDKGLMLKLTFLAFNNKLINWRAFILLTLNVIRYNEQNRKI